MMRDSSAKEGSEILESIKNGAFREKIEAHLLVEQNYIDIKDYFDHKELRDELLKLNKETRDTYRKDIAETFRAVAEDKINFIEQYWIKKVERMENRSEAIRKKVDKEEMIAEYRNDIDKDVGKFALPLEQREFGFDNDKSVLDSLINQVKLIRAEYRRTQSGFYDFL